ncbi:hypothetical protein LBE40_08030 [Bartonella taylorii]|uniref:hypothetical protein n=1 Tax=Bartonella taylorii TaxID=33046 RepID=UPI00208E3C60|nr:hypothetical protein [Bartonella taylorii]USP01206.1 hypothetical protein LBE40_08030 [Bartonella taylorii]
MGSSTTTYDAHGSTGYGGGSNVGDYTPTNETVVIGGGASGTSVTYLNVIVPGLPGIEALTGLLNTFNGLKL